MAGSPGWQFFIIFSRNLPSEVSFCRTLGSFLSVMFQLRFDFCFPPALVMVSGLTLLFLASVFASFVRVLLLEALILSQVFLLPRRFLFPMRLPCLMLFCSRFLLLLTPSFLPLLLPVFSHDVGLLVLLIFLFFFFVSCPSSGASASASVAVSGVGLHVISLFFITFHVCFACFFLAGGRAMSLFCFFCCVHHLFN